MKAKQQLDCQLDCKAQASLRSSILNDLSQPDQDLDALLKEKEKQDDDESTPNVLNRTGQ
mgnify:CR=1 FL=1|jgi:hypothetical protein|tara:strand:+ start:362 stop:541 length:180 start_codon:yes stop_codon:yes gene_type:complete